MSMFLCYDCGLSEECAKSIPFVRTTRFSGGSFSGLPGATNSGITGVACCNEQHCVHDQNLLAADGAFFKFVPLTCPIRASAFFKFFPLTCPIRASEDLMHDHSLDMVAMNMMNKHSDMLLFGA